MTRRRWALLALLVTVTATWAIGSAGSVLGAAEQQDDAVAQDPGDLEAPVDAEEADATGTELRALAQAWADGGGTFGYPFWEKASQRWRARAITTPMFREYVTGYRDRVVLGCELLDGVDTSTDAAEAVRDLVLASCSSRLEALREQQRALDDAIRSASGGDDIDPAALERSMAEHEAAASEALQSSYRDARLAMERAQAELAAAEQDLLPEDAFI